MGIWGPQIVGEWLILSRSSYIKGVCAILKRPDISVFTKEKSELLEGIYLRSGNILRFPRRSGKSPRLHLPGSCLTLTSRRSLRIFPPLR